MTETRVAPPASLSIELTTAIVDLLIRLADDELIIGHRNSEWTGLGPILEADIALSSMAQDEIGHALAYYRLAQELGRPDPDTLAFRRKAEEFRCASLVCLERGDWAFTIVRQFLYDAAETVRIDVLSGSAYAPLAALARKIRGEEKYHLMHGRTWLMRLGGATAESKRRMQTAVRTLYPHALGLFEPTPADAVLSLHGIQLPERELAERWRQMVLPALSEACLEVPKPCEPVYGGRRGQHPPELAALVESMQKVFRLDPAAKW